MKQLIYLLFACVIVCCAAQQPNPFGSLPANAWSDTGEPDQTMSPVARATTCHNLGIPYVRVAFANIRTNYDSNAHKFINLGSWNMYTNAVNEGLKTVVNFNWEGGPGSVFPTGTDLNAFGIALNDMLDNISALNVPTKTPALVVIENEEANTGYFDFSVDRQDYLNELNTAISIVHKKGLKITNAGLTEVPLNLYVWHHYYYVQKNYTRAQSFAQRALGPKYFTSYPNLTDINQQKLAISTILIDGTSTHPGYINLPLDYINVHWYHAPGGVVADELEILREGVDLLTDLTKKQVISNEMGARIVSYNDTLPVNAITDIMTYFHQTLHTPYVLWYSGPGPKAPYPVALSTTTGALTKEGVEFHHYITSHFVRNTYSIEIGK